MSSLLRANTDGVRAQQHSINPAVEQRGAACSLTMPPNMGSCIAFAADIIMGSCTRTHVRERRGRQQTCIATQRAHRQACWGLEDQWEGCAQMALHAAFRRLGRLTRQQRSSSSSSSSSTGTTTAGAAHLPHAQHGQHARLGQRGGQHRPRRRLLLLACRLILHKGRMAQQDGEQSLGFALRAAIGCWLRSALSCDGKALFEGQWQAPVK